MAATAKQYLEWHGNQWRVQVRVPRHLQSIIGKKKLLQPLRTANLREAETLKHQHVARFKTMLREAERRSSGDTSLAAEAGHYRVIRDLGGSPAVRLAERSQVLLEKHGPTDEVMAFLEVATGASTPIDNYLDAFIAFKGSYRVKSEGDLRRVVGWLVGWLKSRNSSTYLEDFNRKLAGSFIDGPLVRNRGRKKAGAYLGFLREYWKWLKQRGHVEENPWAGQEIAPEPRRRTGDDDGGKRPFTDDEIARLVYGPARGYLPDLMRMAALTGMRIEEIAQLRVKDCSGDWLRVNAGKTPAARRTIPVHPDLKPIIAVRTDKREGTDYLFGELPEVPESRDTRSDPASKQFTRYRRSVGVDERPNGKAKSNVDFHSFRRWFIRKARDAMATSEHRYGLWVIADIVGHDDKEVKNLLALTASHYPGEAAEADKKACVLAVRLPNPQDKQPTPSTKRG